MPLLFRFHIRGASLFGAECGLSPFEFLSTGYTWCPLLLGGVFWKRTGGPVAHGGFGRAGHSRLSASRCVPGTGRGLTRRPAAWVHLQLLTPASPMDGGGHVISHHSALCINGPISYQDVTLFISGTTLCSTSTWSGSNLCLV